MSNRTLYLSFGVLLLIKISSILWLTDDVGCNSDNKGKVGSIAFETGDSRTYTGAMENFIQEGTYFFVNRGGEKIYAGRLPHYSIPYYLVRLFSSKKLAYDLVVIFQLLFEVWAIILMSLLVFKITTDLRYFFLTAFIFAISLNWTHFSYYLSPESLSISFFCCALYYWHKSYLEKLRNATLLIVGVFLGLLGTLKPYLLPLFLVPGIYFIQQYGVTSIPGWKQIVQKTIIISLPLLIFLTPWTIRNYQIYDKIIPLQINLTAGYYLTDAYFAMRKYVVTWGGQYRWWYPNTAGCFFDPNDSSDPNCSFVLPDYLETVNYSHVDIIATRNLYIKSKKGELKSTKMVAEKFDLLTSDLINEKPAQTYLLAPIRLLKGFIVHSGSYYLPLFKKEHRCFQWIHYVLKISQSVLYWCTLIIGIMGLFLMQVHRTKMILGIFLIAYLILLFPIILREVEWRMFHITYPVLVIGFVYLVRELINKFQKVEIIKNSSKAGGG